MRAYFFQFLHLLVVSYSRANRTAQDEENTPSADTEGHSDEIDVVVEATTDDVLECHEIFSE